MSHLPIYETVLGTTRGQILALLRRSDSTVSELAEALELTENAIRNHLSTLERDGMVETRGVRREGVGKPARVYAFAPEAENFFPKGYDTVLNLILTLLGERMGREELKAFLVEAGRTAGQGRIPEDADFQERADAAMELCRDLGAVAEVRSNGDLRIQSFTCPLTTVTREHHDVCKLVEALISEMLGVPVREVCDRGERPCCAFVVEAPSGD